MVLLGHNELTRRGVVWYIMKSLISACHECMKITMEFLINPLRAKLFRGNINIYQHFVSFLHIDTMQVVNIMAADVLVT